MEHLRRIVPILLFVLLLLPCEGSGQFTVTRSELETILMNSTRMNTTLYFGPPASVDLGSPSASVQTFDFSSLPADTSRDTGTMTFVAPDGQPGSAEFPGATMCAPMTMDLGGVGSMTNVIYFSVEDDGFYQLGMYQLTVTPLGDDESVMKNRPKQLVFPLPLSYGTSRTMTDTMDLDFTGSSFMVTTITVTCDGFGDATFPDLSGLILPKTTLAAALRFTIDEIQETYLSGLFSERARTRSVGFISPDGTLMDAELSDTAFTGGTGQVVAIEYSEPSGTTGIRTTGERIPGAYSVSANFPNPFNPATSIAFTVPREGYVSIRVFDVLGREVAELVGREMLPGSYELDFDAAGLPSGVYIYRMTAGEFTQTRKMNLLK